MSFICGMHLLGLWHAFFIKCKHYNEILFYISDFWWLAYLLAQLSFFTLTSIAGTMNSSSVIDHIYIYSSGNKVTGIFFFFKKMKQEEIMKCNKIMLKILWIKLGHLFVRHDQMLLFLVLYVLYWFLMDVKFILAERPNFPILLKCSF